MSIYETITALTADRVELHLLRTRDWLGGPELTACGDPVVATSADRSIAVLLAGGAVFECDDYPPPLGVWRASPRRPTCARCRVVRAMLRESEEVSSP